MDKIGKYVIQKELGRGAMGIVYKAEDPIIGRIVAIKTIRMDYLDKKTGQGGALKRFIREAQSAGNLSHPNIITIHDINEDQDVMYIVMEYISGTSLEDQILSDKVFSVDEVVQLMTPVAQALDYAHSKGVIHRDVKPGNIIVDESGKPIIVDANHDEILQFISSHPIDEIWLSPIGSQGHIFGRGNRQIPLRVIKQTGKQNIKLFSAGKKIQNTPLLFTDTGDNSLDNQLLGYYQVITGYHESIIRKVIL